MKWKLPHDFCTEGSLAPGPASGGSGRIFNDTASEFLIQTGENIPSRSLKQVVIGDPLSLDPEKRGTVESERKMAIGIMVNALLCNISG
jgi:hypothetical protein